MLLRASTTTSTTPEHFYRRLNHDKAVLSGAHDEAAVKQFLIEQAVVDSSELTSLGKSHTCVIERYSAYFPGQCVPTQAIMDYLSGKLVRSQTDAKDPVQTFDDVDVKRNCCCASVSGVAEVVAVG